MKDLDKFFNSYKDLYEAKTEITTLWRRKQPYFLVDYVNKKRALQIVKKRKARRKQRLYKLSYGGDPYRKRLEDLNYEDAYSSCRIEILDFSKP